MEDLRTWSEAGLDQHQCVFSVTFLLLKYL